MVDGLIIPRTYNDYFSRSDPAAIRQLVAQFTDAALSATSENPVQNKVVKAALDVINAVIPAGASASDKLALESSVDAIDAKIPTQASAQNQLADKDFVNSSIGTNTANYISDNGDPFTSVAALEAYSGIVTNNDYAFVTGTDAAGNVYYDRYKATVSGASVSWAKEYRLNNSSFTAAQWAAISSGITAAKVAQYDAGVTPANVVESGNMSAVTSNAVFQYLPFRIRSYQKKRVTISSINSHGYVTKKLSDMGFTVYDDNYIVSICNNITGGAGVSVAGNGASSLIFFNSTGENKTNVTIDVAIIYII